MDKKDFLMRQYEIMIKREEYNSTRWNNQWTIYLAIFTILIGIITVSAQINECKINCCYYLIVLFLGLVIGLAGLVNLNKIRIEADMNYLYLKNIEKEIKKEAEKDEYFKRLYWIRYFYFRGNQSELKNLDNVDELDFIEKGNIKKFKPSWLREIDQYCTAYITYIVIILI